MTFSILGRDKETGALGAATATGSLAVGAQVPHCAFGVGAIVTQGHSTNMLYACDGLALLRQGKAAEDVAQELVDGDSGRDYRQMAVLDASGHGAGWTGVQNGDHKDQVDDNGIVVIGNLLAGPAVLKEMHAAYAGCNAADLAERLLTALQAGQAAGGDIRGTLSAALVVDDGNGAALNLRIDYAASPVEDLIALHARSRDEEYRAFLQRLPNRDDPHRY